MSVQRHIDRILALEAAQWFEALRNATDDERQAFISWISQSPHHMQAFLRISAEDTFIKEILVQDGVEIPRTPPAPLELPTTEFLRRTQEDRSAAQKTSRWVFFGARLWPRLAVAAVMALLAIATLLFTLQGTEQKFTTQVGEQRVVPLPDGSVMHLNTATEVVVRFTHRQREVRIVRGEASFKVAHNTARPFQVETNDAFVRDIGTEFNVYSRDDEATIVSVIEGHVGVSAHTTDDEPQATLVAGEQVSVLPSGALERIRVASIRDSIAWEQRKLIFRRSPLSQIIREFNRYNKNVRMRVSGASGSEFTFTGVFDADDPQTFAVILQKEPGLKVTRSDGEIVITAQADPDKVP